VQGDVAVDLDGADHKIPGRDQYDPAPVPSAGVNGRLECGGVEGLAVAFGREIPHIVNSRTQIYLPGSGRLGLIGFSRTR
jgi:hypothetical protein